MSQSEFTRWCPHCARPTAHARIPQIAGDEELIRRLSSSADPHGFFGRYYCLTCRALWRSVELPVEFVEGLRTSAEISPRPRLSKTRTPSFIAGLREQIAGVQA
jgi:hypothetical protein